MQDKNNNESMKESAAQQRQFNDAIEKQVNLRTQALQDEINELKKREANLLEANQNFQSIIRSFSDFEFQIELDAQKRLIKSVFSENVKTLTGLHADALNHNPFQLEQLVHPDDIASFKEHFSREMNLDNRIKTLVYRIQQTPESPYQWFVHNIRIATKDHITQISGFVKDISSIKQSKEDNRSREETLRESNMTKDKFFSIIAHDLKNPFNAIMGFSNLLFEEYDTFDDEEKKGFIANIHEASESTFKLLENLLQWSRAQTGRLDYRPEHIDLSFIASDTLAVMKPNADNKGIIISSLVEFETMVYGDLNMITTVFRNLVSNAIKFSYAGDKVTIHGRQIDDFVEITVEDTGIGMAPENLKKLFHIDSQYKLEGTAHEQGTGLGLILCKEFVEKHGGKIWAESEEGVGSKFKFILPMQAAV